jgi:hypothetical protein
MSSDGVAVMVSRLHQRALVTGAALKEPAASERCESLARQSR